MSYAILDSKEVTPALAEALSHYLEPDAAKLCLELLYLANFYDDVYDGDKPKDVYKALIIDMVSIRRNPFFLRFQGELTTLITSMTLQWIAANKLEENKEHLEKAYMLRAGIYQVIAYCAFLSGGLDHYLECGDEIYKLYGETFENYSEELNYA